MTPVTPEIANDGLPGVPLVQLVPPPVNVSVICPEWFAGIASGLTEKEAGTIVTVLLFVNTPSEIVNAPVLEPVDTTSVAEVDEAID